MPVLRTGVDDRHDRVGLPGRDVPGLGQLDVRIVPLVIVKLVAGNLVGVANVVRLGVNDVRLEVERLNRLERRPFGRTAPCCPPAPASRAKRLRPPVAPSKWMPFGLFTLIHAP